MLGLDIVSLIKMINVSKVTMMYSHGELLSQWIGCFVVLFVFAEDSVIFLTDRRLYN